MKSAKILSKTFGADAIRTRTLRKTNFVRSITNGLPTRTNITHRVFRVGGQIGDESTLPGANPIRSNRIRQAAVMTDRVMKAAVQRRLIRLKRGFTGIWIMSETASKLNSLIRPERVNIELPATRMKKMLCERFRAQD